MASEDKIFVDTDVALDHLADRQPFAEYAHRLFGLAETRELTLCLSSLSFSNLYYLLRKLKGHDEAIKLLSKISRITRISAYRAYCRESIEKVLALFNGNLHTEQGEDRNG